MAILSSPLYNLATKSYFQGKTMPIAEGITSGVIGHVLTGLLTHAFSRDADIPKILKRIEKAISANTEIGQTLQEAAAATARFAKLGKSTPERVRSFLVSPEVESMLRQIFSTQLLKREPLHIETLRREFHSSLVLHLGSTHEVPADLSNALFDTLLASCSRAIDTALNRGSISALATKITFDSQMLLGEIAAINANLSFLTKTHGLEPDRINEFEKFFRKQVAKAHQYIIPHDLDSAKRVAIDKLYVSSDLVRVVQKEADGVNVGIPAKDFMSFSHRSVILGNPGGGKSTFATKLCHDVATRYSDRLFAGKLLTPVFVTLRDYGIQKKSRGYSVMQYIESIAVSDYQAVVPPGALDYLLLNGRLIVIFDGLDELLETSDRQRIRSDVELFAEWYPSAPILVTSREVGYEQAPLDERFETFKLSSFSDDQVKQYVSKRFSLNTDLPATKQKQLAGSFFEESKLVPDLRSNPLMLALMCNIYNIDGYIPRNRPEVYRKCAEMLFDKWDKRRGIHYALPFEAYVRPAMHDLAYWIYADENLQGGVAEDLLIGRASEYLKEWCFDSLEEAKSAATKFIEFCRGRAWVLSDTGTKEGGEKLYQFTHRTFLEYFTAEQLANTCRLPADLSATLQPHIAKREWDIVCQLAYQLKGKNSPSNTNELFRDLLERASNSLVENEHWNYLSFAARCLEFMVPSPQVRRDLGLACLKYCIEWGSTWEESDSGKTEAPRSRQLISNLLNAASENRATIAEVVRETLVGEIKVGSPMRQGCSADLALNLSYAAQVNRSSAVSDEVKKVWREVSNAIVDECREELLKISERDFTVCAEMLYKGLSVKHILDRFGVSALFKERPSRILQIQYGSIAEAIFRMTLQSAAKGEFKTYTSAVVRDVGKILLNAPVPWVSDPETLRRRYLSWVIGDVQGGGFTGAEAIDGDLLFGLLAMACVFIETDQAFLLELLNSRNSLVKLFRSWLTSPLTRSGESKVQRSSKKAGLTADQSRLISDWSHGKLELVRGSGHAGLVRGSVDPPSFAFSL
ncbi:MAG: NACHT domain-containing protein [Terriglobales bacterium]